MKTRIKILVGIDEYPDSRHTFQAGAGLSSVLGAELRFVHAAGMSRPGRLSWLELPKGGEDARLVVQDQILERFKAWSVGTALEGRDLEPQSVVQFADPTGLLTKEAETQGADWVVIGKHRKHGWLDFGNTMRKTFAACHLPIWVQVGPWKKPERILAAIDLSPISKEVMVEARRLAATCGASVQVTYCFAAPMFATPLSDTDGRMLPNYVIEGLEEDDKKRFDALVDDFDWQGVPFDKHFAHSDPVDYLGEEVGRYDLTIMGQHGEGWISGTVMGSIAYGILKRAEAPILALRHQG